MTRMNGDLMATLQTSPANSLLDPETIARRLLPNGMTALARENTTSPTASVIGLLSAGSVTEEAEQAGLAGFVADMLMRGTEQRSFAQINETVESVGASIDVSGGRHATSFSGKSLAEDMPLILDTLADVLGAPTFPSDHVERLRGQVLTGIEERENDTRSMAGLTFRELAYPDHPYGRALGGYRHTVTTFTREEMSDFYGRFYSPQGAVVVLVGAIEAGAALDLLENAFGSWTPEAGETRASLPPIPPLDDVRRRDVTMSGKIQSDIVLGAPALSRRDPDYFPALVANTVLGRFGMMGRLGSNVREKQGLAYYSFSALEAGHGPGPWSAIAGVNPDNVERALTAILQEIGRLRDEAVPDDELNDVKGFLTGSLPLRLETNAGVANALIDMEWFDLGLDYVQHYPNLINTVTPEQIMAATQKYLDPEAYVLAIAGPGDGQP